MRFPRRPAAVLLLAGTAGAMVIAAYAGLRPPPRASGGFGMPLTFGGIVRLVLDAGPLLAAGTAAACGAAGATLAGSRRSLGRLLGGAAGLGLAGLAAGCAALLLHLLSGHAPRPALALLLSLTYLCAALVAALVLRRAGPAPPADPALLVALVLAVAFLVLRALFA